MIMEEKNRMITNDEMAAVAIALYQYSTSLYHDEPMVLTADRAAKANSTWSSKIFGLRQFPNRK